MHHILWSNRFVLKRKMKKSLYKCKENNLCLLQNLLSFHLILYFIICYFIYCLLHTKFIVIAKFLFGFLNTFCSSFVLLFLISRIFFIFETDKSLKFCYSSDVKIIVKESYSVLLTLSIHITDFI